MFEDVKRLLDELPQASSIEVVNGEKFSYHLKVHGVLAKETFGKIVKTARKHGLKIKHLTNAYDCINLVFEEADA